LDLDSLLSLWSLYRVRKTLRPYQDLFSHAGGQFEIVYKNFCLFRQSASLK
jgi:hypothetical protein